MRRATILIAFVLFGCQKPHALVKSGSAGECFDHYRSQASECSALPERGSMPCAPDALRVSSVCEATPRRCLWKAQTTYQTCVARYGVDI